MRHRRKLAGELLNDWDAIVRVIETLSHPLTNNPWQSRRKNQPAPRLPMPVLT